MKWISTLFISTWIGWAHAGLMAPVFVEGREWLQPVDFNITSWQEINAVCPDGVCGAGTVRGHNIAGWSWATLDDVIALFETTTPYVHDDGSVFEAPFESQWATDFFDVYGFEPTNESTGEFDFRYLRGIVSTTLEPPLQSRAVMTLVYDSRMPSLTDKLYTGESLYSNQRYSGVGAWFYREAAAVPSPGVLPLLFISLAGLCLMRASTKAS